MQLNNAIELIEYNFAAAPQVWADLGCGTGIFTRALARLLPPGSMIHAMDKNKSALEQIPDQFENVEIKKRHGDFIKEDLPNHLDGILMANSLHFVKDKISFLKNAVVYFKPEHYYLVVEYDSDAANYWVPFPVSFDSLKQLFQEAGYTLIKKLRERPSVYREANIYSGLIKK